MGIDGDWKKHMSLGWGSGHGIHMMDIKICLWNGFASQPKGGDTIALLVAPYSSLC